MYVRILNTDARVLPYHLRAIISSPSAQANVKQTMVGRIGRVAWASPFDTGLISIDTEAESRFAYPGSSLEVVTDKVAIAAAKLLYGI